MGELAWLVAVVLVVFVVGAALLMLPSARLSARAKGDYRRARGTQHRHQLEQALAAVRSQVAQLRSDTAQLEQDTATLADEETRDLDQALAHHLVSSRLDEVPGVGRTRVAAIKSMVFQGRLTDLHSAHRIPGIGPSTQYAISDWVRQTHAAWPQLRQTQFPGKQQILDRFANQRRDLERRRTTLAKRISDLERLDRLGTDELKSLSWATVADFRSALKRRKDWKDAEALQRYILGAFPPWGTMPPWYVELLNAAQGEPRDGRVT